MSEQTPPSEDAKGLAMPGESSGSVDLPPPPKFGKQMAQLVVIPALIVIFCIGMAIMFGMLAGAQTSIDAYLMKLRQNSGAGRMAFNMQDPRYKDRGLAAYNIATLIPDMKDPAERLRVSEALAEILDHYVGDEEDMLQAYLLLALGQLGQECGFEPILIGLGSKHKTVRQAAIGGLLSWPDKTEAAVALPQLAVALGDEDPLVATEAAVAIGELAQSGDAVMIAALQDALGRTGTGWRELGWNTAVALARLNDSLGSQIVAEVLLDREALALLPMAQQGPAAQRMMSPAGQDRIILSTLTASVDMQDERVWAKIKLLAEKDSNRVIRKAATQLIRQHTSTAAPTGL